MQLRTLKRSKNSSFWRSENRLVGCCAQGLTVPVPTGFLADARARKYRHCTNYRVLSAIACSIKGNVKKNISPSTGSGEKLLDFQPPQPRKTLGSGMPRTAWLILFSILVALFSGGDNAARS